MKIQSIQKSNVNFTAGKIEIYSDFDGTYFPEKHSNLYGLPQEKAKSLNNYFGEFRKFLIKLKDILTFKITTGRTFGEFETVSELIKSKGIKMPYPDALIVKNGSDEYPRKSGKFPFDYNSVNEIRENEIKSETNWNRGLREKLKEILSKYNFEIIESDSENSVRDYGQKSIMAHVRYDGFELTEDMQPQSEWKVGIRNDGVQKLYISFPYDMLHAQERKVAYEEIQKSFEEVLNSDKVKFVKSEYRDVNGGNRPIIEYSPQMSDGKPLDKIYDTRKAVQKAFQENDLVIAAGNGKNDYAMLNPLNYIDTEGLKPEIQKELKNVSEANIETLLKDTQIAERLRKLPFVGVVIKGGELDNLFKRFVDFNKIIEIENLKDGIKLAIKTYVSENKEFANSLSETLKKEFNLITEQTAENINVVPENRTLIKVTSQTSQKARSKGKIAAIIAAISAGVSAIVLFFKGDKSANPTGK